MDIQLEKFFNQIFGPTKYLKPIDFCPLKGVQFVEQITRHTLGVKFNRGMCSIWSFAYAYYRLKYPKYNRKTITHMMSNRLGKGSNLWIIVENIVLMLADISERLRMARTEDEMREVLLDISMNRRFGY